MDQRPHRLSIFSQSLDSAAFVGYFLGAVVPLLTLAYVSHKYVLPELTDGMVAKGLIALILSVGALSLASYLVLRRATKQNMDRIEGDNDRLQAILEAARGLSTAPHRSAAAQAMAACAAQLTDARAAYVFVSEKLADDEELVIAAQIGEQSTALYSDARSGIDEAARLAMQFGRTVLRGKGHCHSDEEAGPPICAVAVGGQSHGSAALVVVGERETPSDEETDSVATLAALGSVALRNSELQDIQRNFFVQLTDILVSVLDQHLDYHEGHARRVAHISNRLGRELGLDDERLQRLHFASLLHDIGMLKIPIDKHADKKIARTHPAIGHRMLNSIRVWEDLAPFVLHHHEWFNGEGYPEGLAGDDIPFEARIIGLAEAVDSMISQTSYKDAVSKDEMGRRVDSGSGTQFDPDIARVFLDLVERDAIDLG